MAKINLLPWREERRAELKREFFVILAASAIVGGGLVYLANMQVSSKVKTQVARNEFIKKASVELDTQIKEIDELKKQKERLIERMRVIQDLQGNRPVIVRMFDELAQTIPDGLHLTKLTKQGTVFTLEGIAESNNKVSRFMRNLNASDWFKDPNLSLVKTMENDEGEDLNSFALTVSQHSPQTSEESEG